MKRTRAQNPKLQDPLDPSAAVAATPNPKPQRRAKQPRQPKAPAKKTSSASSAAAAAADAARDAAAAAAASPAVSSGADMAATVPDVCSRGGEELAAAQPGAEWEYQLDGGGLLSNGEGSWWTFGVEEEKLLGWFPFVEEDFFRCRGADAEFDDDIWRIHQIYEIPSYAAK